MQRLSAHVRSRLKDLRVPCLVIHAKEDDISDVSNARDIQRGAIHAKVELVLRRDHPETEQGHGGGELGLFDDRPGYLSGATVDDAATEVEHRSPGVIDHGHRPVELYLRKVDREPFHRRAGKL